MYAVIETGGKQYKVQAGDFIQIEKLSGDKGTEVSFDKILFWSAPESEGGKVLLGKPFIEKAKVQAEIVSQGRGDKILIRKMKRRKGYRKSQGHRQEYTQVIVTALDNGAGETASVSTDDKKKLLSRFQSHLKPKGLGHTPKTLGSRKRAAEKAETQVS
jgi:large subunit ribosomal protein L21